MVRPCATAPAAPDRTGRSRPKETRDDRDGQRQRHPGLPLSTAAELKADLSAITRLVARVAAQHGLSARTRWQPAPRRGPLNPSVAVSQAACTKPARPAAPERPPRNWVADSTEWAIGYSRHTVGPTGRFRNRVHYGHVPVRTREWRSPTSAMHSRPTSGQHGPGEPLQGCTPGDPGLDLQHRTRFQYATAPWRENAARARPPPPSARSRRRFPSRPVASSATGFQSDRTQQTRVQRKGVV